MKRKLTEGGKLIAAMGWNYHLLAFLICAYLFLYDKTSKETTKKPARNDK